MFGNRKRGQYERGDKGKGLATNSMLWHLTLAVSGRRPDAAFHVYSKPHAGGGHEHGVVRRQRYEGKPYTPQQNSIQAAPRGPQQRRGTYDIADRAHH